MRIYNFLLILTIFTGKLFCIDNKNVSVKNEYKAKTKKAKKLLIKAKDFFEKNSLEKSCDVFLRSSKWKKGDLFVFVIDSNHRILCFGDFYNIIWQDSSVIKTVNNKAIYDSLSEKENSINRSTAYLNSEYIITFGCPVEKNGEKYVLGTAFYPEGSDSIILALVKSLYDISNKQSIQNALDLIKDPESGFVMGDINPIIFDLDNPNYSLKDKLLFDLLVKESKSNSSGWVDINWNKLSKRFYFKLYHDEKNNKNYIICAGYYPKEKFEDVVSYVKGLVADIVINGPEKMISQVSNNPEVYLKGSLSPIVLSLNESDLGKCLLWSEYPDLVGSNILNFVDSKNKKIFVKAIEKLEDQNFGTVSFLDKNAYGVLYFNKLDAIFGKYLFCSIYFPKSKAQVVEMLVSDAVSDMKFEKNIHSSFAKFADINDRFFKYGAGVFVYNVNGTLLLNGPDKQDIWSNFKYSVDAKGRFFISDLIEKGSSGGGWLSYHLRNSKKFSFVEPIDLYFAQDYMQNMIVGSGYYI